MEESELINSLERYAAASRSKVYSSQADLDPKDRPHMEMASWCLQREGIIVLTSGMILTSNPTSRDVQNCKTQMINKGLRPGKVCAATPRLITVLMENIAADEDIETAKRQEVAETKISTQHYGS